MINTGHKIRHVAVVTGTRAEYGILKPLLTLIEKGSDLELSLLVTGLHLLNSFGMTIQEIRKDGFKITAEVPMYSDSLFGDARYHGVSLGEGTKNFTNVLRDLQPDILLVFGDRLEALAATLAAATLNIPIGHIHAGDKTDSGHIDEQVRFSISRFSHLLFAPTNQCAERLIKMGEEPWRVHNVGALGLDSVLSIEPIPKIELEEILGVDLDEPTAIVIFHPVIHEHETIGLQMEEILKALIELNLQSVIIYPNNDLGSEKIISVIDKYSHIDKFKIFKNLEHQVFVSLMHYASVMVGNSSSGIIEAPSLGLPVVNVGSRNRGREHGDNVIFVDPKKEDIIKAIKRALYDTTFLNIVKERKNPYGDGETSKRILRVLESTNVTEKFLKKKLTH